MHYVEEEDALHKHHLIFQENIKAHPRNFQEIDAKYAIHILKVSLVKIIS